MAQSDLAGCGRRDRRVVKNMREQIIQKIKEEKLIAIVRGIMPELCLKVAQALYDGGVRFMEITYNQNAPESWIQTAEAIQAVAEAFDGRMFVGAGTVTNVELVEMTYSHKGQYIISPDTDIDVIKRTRELNMVSMPGAMTPSEIKQAYDAGADFVKLFPAGILGPNYLKAVKAPLNHIPILAVGGISDKNVQEFLAAGAEGFGIGGNLAKKAWIDAGEFHKLTEAAMATVAAIKGE